MYLPTERVVGGGGGHGGPSSPTFSPIYCLQTVRMTKFKSDGIWCLVAADWHSL